jgi:hypothetical protein
VKYVYTTPLSVIIAMVALVQSAPGSTANASIALSAGEYVAAQRFRSTDYQETASGLRALFTNTAISPSAAFKLNSIDPSTIGGASTSAQQNEPSGIANQSIRLTANQAPTTSRVLKKAFKWL